MRGDSREGTAMKKFINHIDHITWVSYLDSFEDNVAKIEEVTGIQLQQFDNEELGFRMYLSWEAGIEIMAPLPHRTEFNTPVHDYLEKCGERVYAVVFGVRDLELTRELLEKLGYCIGPRMGEEDASGWDGKVIVRERIGPQVMNCWMVLGELDYRDDMISYVDV